jgi:hypothetical protein
MKLIVLTLEELLEVGEKEHNPSVFGNQKEKILFQAEARGVYKGLVELLSAFGEEGDYYGISDFAIRPDLRDRPTVRMPPPYPVREFGITVITDKFYRSDYLEALHDFLTREAPGYRIEVYKDFDPTWSLTMFLTADTAQIYCTDAKELSRLERLLGRL